MTKFGIAMNIVAAVFWLTMTVLVYADLVDLTTDTVAALVCLSLFIGTANTVRHLLEDNLTRK